MTSYLGEYPNSAKDKEKKFIRSIDSLLQQTYDDYELIVVSDGCDKTIELIVDNYNNQLLEKRIRVIKIKKNREVYGMQRQHGVSFAEGEYITYLDTDDKISMDHLEIINNNIGDNDAVFYNDYIYSSVGKWMERNCELQRFRCGTSNITHRKEFGVWRDTGYAHDWHFIQSIIKRTKRVKKIKTPGYLVCHIPRSISGKGYDV